jgi:hypothetical protein
MKTIRMSFVLSPYNVVGLSFAITGHRTIGCSDYYAAEYHNDCQFCYHDIQLLR